MARVGWQLKAAQRITYSVGMFSTSMVTATVMAWILYFYAPPPNAVDLGMVFLGAGVAVGLARLFGSLVDALTNPLIAFWSDRSTNPAGRRIPFIRKGLLPLVLLAILLWFPPVRGTSNWNVVWLAATLGGTWFFYTYVVAPYLALMPELTTNAEERISLTVTMAYWEAGAIVLTSVGVPPLIEAFKGGLQLGPLYLADGYKITAILLALIGAVGFLVSVSRIRERPPEAAAITRFNLWQSIVECFRNPAFPPYLLAVSAAKIGIGLVMIALPFVATAVLHKGEGFAAILVIPLFLSTIVGFAAGERFVNRVGLKAAFRTATLIATGVTFAFFLTTFAGSSEQPLSSARTDIPSGDLLMVFGDGQAPADFPGENPPRISSEAGRVAVRISRLEWESLFLQEDLEAFRKHVARLSPAAAGELLRADTAEERDGAQGRENDWLAEQELPELLAHLRPEAGPLLFKGGKRRFDERLHVALTAPPPPVSGQGLHLPLSIGALSEPERTFNLAGWTQIFSSPESRAAEPPAVRYSERRPVPFETTGRVAWSDGSLVLTGFGPLAGEAGRLAEEGEAEDAIRQVEALSADAPSLEALLSRFDLRIELSWSIRIWIVLFLFLLLGFPAAILMSMYRPIVCEIVDLDEQRCGTRREAIYFGVEGLLTKLADGIAAVVAPAVMLLGHLLMPPPYGYMVTFPAAGIFLVAAYRIFKSYPLGGRGHPASPRLRRAGGPDPDGTITG